MAEGQEPSKQVHPDYSMNIAGWLLFRMIAAGNEQQVGETVKSVAADQLHTIKRDAETLADLCGEEIERRHPEPGDE